MEQMNFYRETGLNANQYPQQYTNWLIEKVNYKLKLSLLDFQCSLHDCMDVVTEKPAPQEKAKTRVIQLAA
ncbi:MAG: hypothetical protein EOP51_06150 [Sphingobacteriales bacterium]|nr:MAG: hypothetical protein EOP51_06150 [Sphingobacteriales bacterium]